MFTTSQSVSKGLVQAQNLSLDCCVSLTLIAKEIANFMYFVQDVPMAMLNIFTAFKIICQKLAVAAKRGGGGMGVSCTSSFSWPPRLSPCQISLPFCVCYRHRL